MFPEGTLFVIGPETFCREVAMTLDQIYPGVLFGSRRADGTVVYILNVPLPIGPVYTQISVLTQYGFSGSWFPWNEVLPHSYRPEQAQWAF